jgi:hypothetical protein
MTQQEHETAHRLMQAAKGFLGDHMVVDALRTFASASAKESLPLFAEAARTAAIAYEIAATALLAGRGSPRKTKSFLMAKFAELGARVADACARRDA